MSEKLDDLKRDLDILEAMADEMNDYLISDVLYWNMVKGDMPKLTLGGYLVRAYRLSKLPSLLNEEEKGRLETAVAKFNEAVTEKIIRVETHAHEELGVRARQWGTYIDDLRRDGVRVAVNYKSAVENRAMIEALVDCLETAPYQFNREAMGNLGMMDHGLKTFWKSDGFIWPIDWQPAYPQGKFWWLYGNIG